MAESPIDVVEPISGTGPGSDSDSSAPVITDDTGGSKNFDIQAIFQSFGYTPTQAEIDALAPSFEVRKNTLQTGESAVANYVQAHQAIGQAQSLIQGNLTAETTGAANAEAAGTADQAAGTASFNQAQQTLQSAPKLFGSLTPDQVSQYLAPLQSQFNYGLGQVTGNAASRGLAGSSLEAQAMAQAQAQYQQSVLSQGLSVGQQQQQALAQSQQALGTQQFSAAGQQYGLAPQYLGLANQSAGTNATVAGSIAGLPGQAVAQALAQQATLAQMNKTTPSFGQQLLGSLQNAGVQDITNLGQNLVGSIIPQTQPGNTSMNSLGSLTSLLGGSGGGTGLSPTGAPLTGGAAGGGSDATAGLMALA